MCGGGGGSSGGARACVPACVRAGYVIIQFGLPSNSQYSLLHFLIAVIIGLCH